MVSVRTGMNGDLVTRASHRPNKLAPVLAGSSRRRANSGLNEKDRDNRVADSVLATIREKTQDVFGVVDGPVRAIPDRRAALSVRRAVEPTVGSVIERKNDQSAPHIRGCPRRLGVAPTGQPGEDERERHAEDPLSSAPGLHKRTSIAARIHRVSARSIASRALRPYLSAERPALRVYVLRLDGAEAGFVEVDTTPGRFEVTKLVVARRFRGRGVARRLLAHAERVARRLGNTDVRIRAHALDAAMSTHQLASWYTRLGYLPLVGPSNVNVLRKPL